MAIVTPFRNQGSPPVEPLQAEADAILARAEQATDDRGDMTAEDYSRFLRIEGIEAIHRLCEIHGAKWVARIVRNVADLRGERL